MTGYRTIPTKDAMDVDERLGGLITVKQLAYLIAALFATGASYFLSAQIFGSGPETIYLPVVVLFFSVLFIFANLDRWLLDRARYYVLSGHKRLENHPELLRNIRTVEEDKIATLDGRIIAVLKITPINFPLLSDEAKEARIGAYEMYLRQLVYPTMHLVLSEEVDVEEYLSNFARNSSAGEEDGVKGAKGYGDEHAKFLRDYLAANHSRSKYHYLVLSVQDPRHNGGAAPESDLITRASLLARSALTEFQPTGFLSGGQLFCKPDYYVLIDLIGNRMVFKNPGRMPQQTPPRAKRIGPILQFESKVAMLRWARSMEKAYYYGPVDIITEIKKEFFFMPLREREKEFSLDERRRHVELTAGKTRWAYDEAEKHIAVLSDKLEATGLRVHRLRGEELFSGRQNSLMKASKVSVSPTNILVDSTYMKVVYATGYPYQVNLGWLSNIVDGREDYDLTMYLYPVGVQETLSTFRSAILKLSTEKKARSDFLDPETEQHLEDVKGFFTQIVSGKEKYFLASLYITCKAPSRKSLDTVLEKCKSDLAGAAIDYEVADYDMARAVYSTRLAGSDALGKKRAFPSSSLAATFPHISSSIEIDPAGMFFAFDWMGAPIIFDLTKLPNQHIAITGESGSGKSYFSKSLIPKYLINGYRTYVTDPDGEYTELARRLGGTVSTVGSERGANINPFDLEGRDPNDKIRSLLGLFAIMCGSLSKYQEGILSDILGYVLEGAQKKKRSARVSDVYAEVEHRLSKTKDEQLRHDLQFLRVSMRPFIKGGLYGFVDSPTSIKLGSRLHVFDLGQYKNDKTMRDFFNYVIFDFITHRLLSDKSRKALIMDEGWTMVNYPSSEEYVRYIIKDSRKYNVSFVFITQELEDMLQSQAGRSILNNTATQFTFHQKESAMNLMKSVLNLTHEEYEKLISCGKGEGLLLSDKSRLLFRVRTAEAEHALISADPNEKYDKTGRIEGAGKSAIGFGIDRPEYAPQLSDEQETPEETGRGGAEGGWETAASGPEGKNARTGSGGRAEEPPERMPLAEQPDEIKMAMSTAPKKAAGRARMQELMPISFGKAKKTGGKRQAGKRSGKKDKTPAGKETPAYAITKMGKSAKLAANKTGASKKKR